MRYLSVMFLWGLVLGFPPLTHGAGLPPAVSAAIDSDDWQTVATQLDPLTAGESTDEAALYWCGHAWFRLGEKQKAGALLSRALKHDPRSEPTAVLLAHAAAAASNDVWMAEAVAAQPRSVEICILAGRSKVQASWNDGSAGVSAHKASTLLERAMALAPLSSEAHQWAAQGYLGWTLDYPKVLAHARAAMRAGDVGAEVYYLVAHCYYQLGQFDEAAAILFEVAAVAPHYAGNAHYQRGKMLMHASCFDAAIRAFDDAMRAGARYSDLPFHLGEAARCARNYPLAFWAANVALTQAQDWRAHYTLGRCCYDLEMYERAAKLCQLAIRAQHEEQKRTKGKITGSGSDYAHWRGRALLKSGDLRGGASWLRIAHREAFENEGLNLYYSQWAFHAKTLQDDPHGAIDIAETVAVAGYPDVALRSLDEVVRRWPEARWKELKSGRSKYSHLHEVDEAAAKIHLNNNAFVVRGTTSRSKAGRGSTS